MWLAETSDSWTTPVSKYGVYTPYNKLLEAGFDGYYGSWFELKNWRTANELYNHIKFNRSLLSKYKEPKAVIGSFSTHDEMSPVLINGTKFSEMILWLNATLPLNAYFVDGFQSGDNYIYFWANKKLRKRTLMTITILSTAAKSISLTFHAGLAAATMNYQMIS